MKKIMVFLTVIIIVLAANPVLSVEVEKGMGFSYNRNTEGFGGTPDEYNYQLGTLNLYYGLHRFDFFKDFHLGLEIPIGIYKFSPGDVEVLVGTTLNATVDILNYFYVEGGLGLAYISGAPGHKGEVLAERHLPGIAQFGIGFKFDTKNDSYYRIGARITHHSGIFHGKPFTKKGDPGTNVIGLFFSYYW